MSFRVGEKVEFRDFQRNVYQGVVKSVKGEFFKVSNVTAWVPGDVWIKQNLCHEATEKILVSSRDGSESRNKHIRCIAKEKTE